MKKRGQVSIFIIIAIIIVAIIIIIFLANNRSPFFSQNSPEVGNINSYIEQCANQRALDAVRLIGLQGGYVNLPEEYLQTNLSNIAYGYYEGNRSLPSKTTIEKEISSYVEATTPYCVGDTDFPEYNISLGKAKSTAEIQDNQVSVNLALPATIKKGTKTYSIKQPYEISVPIKLGKIYSTAEFIIDREVKNPKKIELSSLTSLNYYITIIPVDDNNLIYIITDNSSQTDRIPYSFLFANKFSKSTK